MNNETVWSLVLDAFEARIDAEYEALALGAPGVVPPFVAPPLPSPLPDALLDRAVALIARCRRLEADLAEALATTEVSLAKLQDTPATPAAQPVYFDTRV